MFTWQQRTGWSRLFVAAHPIAPDLHRFYMNVYTQVYLTLIQTNISDANLDKYISPLDLKKYISPYYPVAFLPPPSVAAVPVAEQSNFRRLDRIT